MEVSCLISNLPAGLEQPCRMYQKGDLVLTGRSPTSETVTIQPRPDLVLEAEGYDKLLGIAREQEYPDG